MPFCAENTVKHERGWLLWPAMVLQCTANTPLWRPLQYCSQSHQYVTAVITGGNGCGITSFNFGCKACFATNATYDW